MRRSHVVLTILSICVMGLLFACGIGDKDAGKGGAVSLIQEKGDAGGVCSSCQEIKQSLPFIIQGEFNSALDVDCYCFNGKADKTYLLGVTGNKRKITAQRLGKEEPHTGTDGLLVYTPPSDGKVCVCVSGGSQGAYILTVTLE